MLNGCIHLLGVRQCNCGQSQESWAEAYGESEKRHRQESKEQRHSQMVQREQAKTTQADLDRRHELGTQHMEIVVSLLWNDAGQCSYGEGRTKCHRKEIHRIRGLSERSQGLWVLDQTVFSTFSSGSAIM